MAIMVIEDDALDMYVGTIAYNLNRIVGQIFKLLPMREEDGEWEKALETLITEVTGLLLVLPGDSNLLELVSKLAGMRGMEDFMTFRRMVFEACGLASEVIESIEHENS